MRWMLAVAVVAAVAGCSGGPAAVQHLPQAKKAERPRCTHVSGAFRACTVFGLLRGERSSIQRRVGARWKPFAAPPRVRHGWWRKIVASPDGRTLLAQWSGECEIQSTYLVSTVNGKDRPIFQGNSSTAAGWSRDGRARVRLPAPVYGTDKSIRFQAGTYLVEPETMAVSLERPIARRPGC
jgi:hypothetical protein